LQDKRLQDMQTNNTTTLATIQNITGQAFGAMGQVAGRPVTPLQGNGSTDPTTPRVTVCSGCRTENLPASRFCSNCGKKL